MKRVNRDTIVRIAMMTLVVVMALWVYEHVYLADKDRASFLDSLNLNRALRARASDLKKKLTEARRERRQDMEKENPESSSDPMASHSVYPF